MEGDSGFEASSELALRALQPESPLTIEVWPGRVARCAYAWMWMWMCLAWAWLGFSSAERLAGSSSRGGLEVTSICSRNSRSVCELEMAPQLGRAVLKWSSLLCEGVGGR